MDLDPGNAHKGVLPAALFFVVAIALIAADLLPVGWALLVAAVPTVLLFLYLIR